MKKVFTALTATADTVRDMQPFRQKTLHAYTKVTALPVIAL